jgi:outer membrane translocation and assembly module TamA
VVSVHARNDTYRSLRLRGGTSSIFERHHELRDNPPVDEGDAHAVLLRLERQTRRSARTRAGFYHWIELERAGGGLGGDFAYTRALADLRSVVRLSPTATLALRAVGGTTTTGALPPQKEFTAGGADGLRAHAFAQFRGNQLLLAQAEFTTALWRVRPSGFDAGLHAIAFVDAGRAWNDAGHAWAPGRQHLQVDGGFGLATSEDNLRVYVARSLQRPRSGAVISVRFQRPF